MPSASSCATKVATPSPSPLPPLGVASGPHALAKPGACAAQKDGAPMSAYWLVTGPPAKFHRIPLWYAHVDTHRPLKLPLGGRTTMWNVSFAIATAPHSMLLEHAIRDDGTACLVICAPDAETELALAQLMFAALAEVGARIDPNAKLQRTGVTAIEEATDLIAKTIEHDRKHP